MSRTAVAPTRNPSTPGARWLFAQREYLRRAGDTPATRDKWTRLVKRIESYDDAQLKLVVGNLHALHAEITDPVRRTKIAAEMHLGQAELSYRASLRAARHMKMVGPENPPGTKIGKRLANYRGQVAEHALSEFVERLGYDAVRAALIRAGEYLQVRGKFADGTEVVSLVDEMIAFKYGGGVGQDSA